MQVATKVQQFNSPSDLTPMDQLYPTYDIFYLEQRANGGIIEYSPESGQVLHKLFTPPAWLSAWPNVTLDDRTKAVSQRRAWRSPACSCNSVCARRLGGWQPTGPRGLPQPGGKAKTSECCCLR